MKLYCKGSRRTPMSSAFSSLSGSASRMGLYHAVKLHAELLIVERDRIVVRILDVTHSPKRIEEREAMR